MAKKKEPSVQDALAVFKDVAHRATLSDYFMVNRRMVSKTDKDRKVLIIPGDQLFDAIINDEELSKCIKELNINNPDEAALQEIFKFGDDLESPAWIEIDPEPLYKGRVKNVEVHDKFEYTIPIHRNLLPLKLKKAEYNNISYRIFIKISSVIELSIAVKKKFDFPLEGCGFTMIRVFKIL